MSSSGKPECNNLIRQALEAISQSKTGTIKIENKYRYIYYVLLNSWGMEEIPKNLLEGFKNLEGLENVSKLGDAIGSTNKGGSTQHNLNKNHVLLISLGLIAKKES